MKTKTQTDKKMSMALIKPGMVFRHHNGRTCTVLHVANSQRNNARSPRKFPLHVVYMHADGSVWTRRLSTFEETFKRVKLAQGKTHLK